MWKKIRALEERLENFYRGTRLEIDQLKKEAKMEIREESPRVRHSGCNLQSPISLKGIW